MMTFFLIVLGALFCLMGVDLALTARTIKDYKQADDINFLSAICGIIGSMMLLLSFF